MNKKKILKIAKMLFKLSLSGNYLNKVKIAKILREISGAKVLGKRAILKNYKRLVEAQLAKEEITVEIPTAFKAPSNFEKQILTKTGARKIKYRTNAELILGAKVLAGDWIYDSTLDAKLKRLTSAI